MNQCWTNNNRSAKELLNRGSKPRVKAKGQEAIGLVEDVVVHTRPRHSYDVDAHDRGKPMALACNCDEPCKYMVEAKRAGTACNDHMVRKHFTSLLKPSDELVKLITEQCGPILDAEGKLSVGDSSSGTGTSTAVDVPGSTTGKINPYTLIIALDGIVRDYNYHEYGLLVGDTDVADQLVKAVKDWYEGQG